MIPKINKDQYLRRLVIQDYINDTSPNDLEFKWCVLNETCTKLMVSYNNMEVYEIIFSYECKEKFTMYIDIYIGSVVIEMDEISGDLVFNPHYVGCLMVREFCSHYGI